MTTQEDGRGKAFGNLGNILLDLAPLANCYYDDVMEELLNVRLRVKERIAARRNFYRVYVHSWDEPTDASYFYGTEAEAIRHLNHFLSLPADEPVILDNHAVDGIAGTMSYAALKVFPNHNTVSGLTRLEADKVPKDIRARLSV